MRLARWDASTTFRLVWGSLDKTPRLPRNLWLTWPRVGPVDPPHSPTLRQKSEHLMQTANHFLPSWLQQQPVWEQYRCQISLFTAHPEIGGENLSLYAPYWALFCHLSPSRVNTTSTVPHDFGDSVLSVHRRPTSTRPRPTDGQNKNERLAWHRTQSLFTVSSSTSPWCSRMAVHSRDTSLQQPPQRSTKLHLKGTPSVPASSYPIKGQAGDSTWGQQTMDEKRPATFLP
jgi:hypothetical protein